MQGDIRTTKFRRGKNQPSRAELKARSIALIKDAFDTAKELYAEKLTCVHPPRHQHISVVPTTETENGTVLDGSRVTVCGVCLTVTRELA
jgi:hypothetical protein